MEIPSSQMIGICVFLIVLGGLLLIRAWMSRIYDRYIAQLDAAEQDNNLSRQKCTCDRASLTTLTDEIILQQNMEKRLEAFRKLPLRAQLALITSTRANPVLSQNQDYIESLERIHAESLKAATPEQKAAYEQAKATNARILDFG